MPESHKQKRDLIPKRLSNALREILEEAGRPVEIAELAKLAEERGHDVARYGKNLYILAKGESSVFVIDEYPTYKLRSSTTLPTFGDTERGVQYPAAAAKILIGTKDYVDLREIVRSIEQKRLYTFPVAFPEYWMYFYLNGYREHFSRRGNLKIGLKGWRKTSEPHIPDAQAQLWEELGKGQHEKAADVTPKMHEANLETIIVEHLDAVEEGLKLIKRQYVCPGVGRIDVLCEDRRGDLVVIELKKFGVRHDSIIDQVARYMGYIKTHLARQDQGVRGILVVAKADEKLRYAVAAFSSIQIKTFNLSIV